jgi:hypothetical protein
LQPQPGRNRTRRTNLAVVFQRTSTLLSALLIVGMLGVAPTSTTLQPRQANAAYASQSVGQTTQAAPATQPYTGDPVAPRTAPTRLDSGTRFFTETGHLVPSDFLTFYKSVPNAADLFGLPLTEAFPEQFLGGGIYTVQYFERVRVESHPELPPGQQVQLGILGPLALNGRTVDRLPSLPSTSSRLYFPETGHTLSYGFLNYWKSNGGLKVFGFPLSEEIAEDGLTVQYFERARFEYHKDLEGTSYAVQLSPLGYMALKAGHFNLPMGTLVRFNPPRVAEGHTIEVEVAASPGVTVTGQYEGRQLLFGYDAQRGIAWALIGAVPFRDIGSHLVTIDLRSVDGGHRTVLRNLQVVSYPFPSEIVQFDPQTAKLLDPAITSKEQAILNAIFAGRTPEQYWQGAFRMPLDGPIRITSYFATRRCYNCPPGSAPTSYHGGLDMGTPEGTPVHADANGRVVFADALADRGNAIIIDHGMGVFTLYAHNSKLIATVGQIVKKGDIVSLSGNTGLSNGPHLHWELHVSGPGVEPREWVNRVMP